MEPPSTASISILNRSDRRAPVSLLRSAIHATLKRNGRPDGAVCVLLAGDDEIAELNHRFRGLDEATDVLSFPSDAMVKPFLGDIAISVPFAERQARERGIPLRRELAYLAIHGTLHLLGFDDQTDDDRDQMIRLMNEAALDAGIPVDSSWSSMHPEPAFAGDPR